ncbi:Activin_recp domain-containing protein [Caenorhabditis elegans]|uniref:Activin_recp domain-containing protein n=1 Tax=Caenorhabditis elegans TaxID=6239 RepID=Q7YWN0_CAEEL|nr:Activin_recp domain-containing protein [Caenorhabditis elegans]CAE18045.2 Activin_recp domain-containing protein [Caenorhabditis elegans]|eukprot:NP_001024312.2 Uncharacterized protein CELE_ZK287.9 [Caenorhabditis elegans]
MTLRLQKFMGLLVFLLVLCLFDDAFALKCYDSEMQTANCEPIQLWCIKFINGSTITRGCANVNDYCYDEDEGCYPTREENGVTQKWCCCQKDMCNSVNSPMALFSVFFIVVSLWVYF